MATRPQKDQFEIHVFGPGYGEAVLVHLGAGEWLIVDSCVQRSSATPATISYLESIGVDPARAVVRIVASHWHDDHVKGLSNTLRACPNAKFYCSSALMSVQIRALYELYGRVGSRVVSGTGTDEFSKVIALSQERRQTSDRGLGLSFATQNTIIFDRERGPKCSVVSLSPSGAEQELAMLQIGELLDRERAGGRAPRPRLKRLEPNHTAIVLSVRFGDLYALLGADLEDQHIGEGVRGDVGWAAIVASKGEGGHAKASLFKVPHHGSSNAHSEDVWSELLEPSPTAIVTPFRHGRVQLPTESDARRILEKTDDAHISNVHGPGRVHFFERCFSAFSLPTGVRSGREPEGGRPDWVSGRSPAGDDGLDLLVRRDVFSNTERTSVEMALARHFSPEVLMRALSPRGRRSESRRSPC